MPVPEPPDVASVRLVPNIVAVAAKVSVACVSFETVMVTVPVEIELYELSAAFVALTVQVPDDEGVNTAPDNEQLAEPADTSEYVTEPVPEPPVVVNVNVVLTFIVLSAIKSVACANAGPPLLSHVAMYEPVVSTSEHVLVPEPP